MTEPLQDPLFAQPKPVAPLRGMTARQARIYELVCSMPGGITAPELGALMHADSHRHHPERQCEFCGQDGARALREKAIKQRVVRRVAGVYEARVAADQAQPEATERLQIDELPGESFEDLFRGAA